MLCAIHPRQHRHQWIREEPSEVAEATVEWWLRPATWLAVGVCSAAAGTLTMVGERLVQRLRSNCARRRRCSTPHQDPAVAGDAVASVGRAEDVRCGE